MTAVGSCRKFCDNWKSLQLLLQRIGNVLADRLDVASEQNGQLLPVEPNGVHIGEGVDLHAVRAGVDDQLALIRHSVRFCHPLSFRFSLL